MTEALPNFWCSHLAKALVGEQHCLLQTWLTARNKYPRLRQDQGALATWKANHTALLDDAISSYREHGWKCQKEVFFRVTGRGAILAGKADLIVSKTDQRSIVVDVKSGQSRDSDAAQVLIEMCAIPLAWNSPTMLFGGSVRYPPPRPVTPLSANDAAEFKPKMFAMLRQLGAGSQRPTASPGEHTCRFCDVPESDCPDRWKDVELPPALTEEF